MLELLNLINLYFQNLIRTAKKFRLKFKNRKIINIFHKYI